MSSSDDAERARINHAIEKTVVARREAMNAHRIEVPSGSAAHLLSNYLTAYLVEEVVQFFPRYLGLHPAGIPRVELPRRLFISTLARKRPNKKKNRKGKDEKDVKVFFPFASLNVMSRLFSHVSADALERRRMFLDTQIVAMTCNKTREKVAR